MKKLFLLAILSLFGKAGYSQTSLENTQRTDPSSDPKFLEFKKRHDDVTNKKQGLSQTSSYYGYDEKLKSFFLDNIIPTQTPTSVGFSTKSEYLKVLNDWLSKNQHLLKPEHKKSLITE